MVSKFFFGRCTTLGSAYNTACTAYGDACKIEKQEKKAEDARAESDTLNYTRYRAKKLRMRVSALFNGMRLAQIVPSALEIIGVHAHIPDFGGVLQALPIVGGVLSSLDAFIHLTSLVRTVDFIHRFCLFRKRDSAGIRLAVEKIHEAFPYREGDDVTNTQSFNRLKRRVGKACAQEIQAAQKAGTLGQQHIERLSRQAVKRLLFNVLRLSIATLFLTGGILGAATPPGIALFSAGSALLIVQVFVSQGWMETEGWNYSFAFLQKDIAQAKAAWDWLNEPLISDETRMNFLIAKWKIEDWLERERIMAML